MASTAAVSREALELRETARASPGSHSKLLGGRACAQAQAQSDVAHEATATLRRRSVRRRRASTSFNDLVSRLLERF
jgi:hypothetical protein